MSEPVNQTGEMSQEALMEWLRPVEDPELFMSLVDLGLIYSAQAENGVVSVKMTLTSPGCPSAGYLVQQVKERMEQHPGVSHADVMLVFDPKWDPRTMASDEVKDRLGIW
jgi:metal-sulfur cluster biosynthetic enzyme